MNMAEPIETGTCPGFSPAQVQAARSAAQQARRATVEVLEEQSGLDPQRFVQTLATTLHYPAAAMEELHRMAPAFDVLPFTEAMERECLALRDENDALVLVMGDPFNIDLQAWAEQRVAARFNWRLAHRADVAAYLARHEETLHAMDGLLPSGDRDASVESGAADLSFKTISEDTSPVVKLVHSTVYDALKASVSDIHLETTLGGLSIRYRIDGVLTTVGSLAGLELAEQVISRIKIMSELDIAERRVPQDGRFKVSVHGHEVDFRVSIMPSIYGEDAVVRILDKEMITQNISELRLDLLGFSEGLLRKFRRYITQPYGMILVTGPTGSGKTTTLYAALTEIKAPEDKIVTIEDPVEYQIDGITQIPVNEKKGLTFARGLRSILRHDPDKIMVGEIRDPETAQIAIQSALTGHLVFTTVHANNVFDVIGRFLHMQVDPYTFISALNCILAQRLVRVLCPKCKQAVKYRPEQLLESGLSPDRCRDQEFYEARGCPDCGQTGYLGRTAIAELLELSDALREMILVRKPLSEVKKQAKEEGIVFLREVGMQKVFKGVTSLRELNKVTFVE